MTYCIVLGIQMKENVQHSKFRPPEFVSSLSAVVVVGYTWLCIHVALVSQSLLSIPCEWRPQHVIFHATWNTVGSLWGNLQCCLILFTVTLPHSRGFSSTSYDNMSINTKLLSTTSKYGSLKAKFGTDKRWTKCPVKKMRHRGCTTYTESPNQ